MSKRSTGLVELYLGPSGSGKRGRRQSLVGGTVVEDYNSNLHGGRVVVVRLAARQEKVASRKPKQGKQVTDFLPAPQSEVTVGA